MTVALVGATERVVIDAFRLLASDYRAFGVSPVSNLSRLLGSRIRADLVEPISKDFIALFRTMHRRQRACIDLAPRGQKSMSRSEFILKNLIAGSAHSEARAAEAAKLLLDTGQIGDILETASRLALRLEEAGLTFLPANDSLFDALAGHAVEGSVGMSEAAAIPILLQPRILL